MLDDFKSGQPVVYSMLKNAIFNNKLSHAYIFDTNGNSDAIGIVMSFVKMIICSDVASEEKENVCKRIDDGNYADIKIITADGLWIKKEQLLDLQNEFSKKSFEGGKKIYIIKDAEKMNSQTANSILKFLEEPVDETIAILITNNVNLLLPTIISRCQVIRLLKHKYMNTTVLNFSSFVNDTDLDNLPMEDKEKFIDVAIQFIKFLEVNKTDTIIYSKNLWHDYFNDRNLNILAMEIMINFYYDVLKYLASGNVDFFCDRVSDIAYVADRNSINDISKKIEVIDESINDAKCNLNINLLIDNMIIEMSGGVK